MVHVIVGDSIAFVLISPRWRRRIQVAIRKRSGRPRPDATAAQVANRVLPSITLNALPLRRTQIPWRQRERSRRLQNCTDGHARIQTTGVGESMAWQWSVAVANWHIAAKHPQVAPRWHRPLDMLQMDPVENANWLPAAEACHGWPARCFAPPAPTTSACVRFLTSSGPVGKDARLAIEIPFAGAGQGIPGRFPDNTPCLRRETLSCHSDPNCPGFPMVRTRKRECLLLLVDGAKGLSAARVVGNVD